MVDDDKVLLLVTAHGLIANAVLEIDDLFALRIRESTPRFDEFFSLFC